MHTPKFDSRKKEKSLRCVCGHVGEDAPEKSLQKVSKNVEKLLFDRGQVRDEAKNACVYAQAFFFVNICVFVRLIEG